MTQGKNTISSKAHVECDSSYLDSYEFDDEMGEDLEIESGKKGNQALYAASQWQLMWWRFRKHRLAMISSLLLIFL